MQEHDNPVFLKPEWQAEWQDVRQKKAGESSASHEVPGLYLVGSRDEH